jgi:hypothetical protein
LDSEWSQSARPSSPDPQEQQQPQQQVVMSSTSQMIADSVSEHYAKAMDDAIDDANRMESERDAARAQLATLQHETQQLQERVRALAIRLRNRTVFIATLGAAELQGNVIGPVGLLNSDYQSPQGNPTPAEVDQLLALPE